MTLSEISIKRPVFAWMLMLALILFGAIAFKRLGVSQVPDVDFPTINISIKYPGAAPEVMETDVVDAVENAVMTIQGIKQVTSSSKSGSANVSVELELERNIDLALQDVQAKIAEAQRNLPKDIEPVVISKTNPDDQPIMWLTLESEKHTLRELMLYVRDHLQGQFSTTPDVGDINLGGFIDPNLRVWVSEKKLDQYALTVNDIIQTIQNEHSEPPAGTLAVDKKEYNIRTMGEAKTVEEFGALAIQTRGGQPNYTPIYLNQVARIEEGLADVRRISRGNGKPAVGLGIRKQRGSNAVKVAKEVRRKMELLSKTLPEGMKLATNFDSTKFIEESVSELYFTLILSAILTSLVCWIFLGSWTSTLNVLLAIPTSIIGTFLILYYFGFTLNLFTLLGLSLAIGIVVDDAIMVLENIIRYNEAGKNKVEAALLGSIEITPAAVAATLSIMAIFIPVVFMQGVIGKFFFQFGITMTGAVLISLLEALTLTPMRCSQFIQIAERKTRFGKGTERLLLKLTSSYTSLLKKTIQHPYWVVFFAVIFFIGSISLSGLLNKEMMPPEDQGRFLIRVQTPMGSSIGFTDTKFKEVEKAVSQRPEIERFYASVGGFGGGEVNTGIIFISMKAKGQRGIDPKNKKEMTQFDLMNLFRKELNAIPEVTAKIQDLSMRSFASGRGFPIEFAIQGPDWDTLGKSSETIKKKLEDSGFATDVDSNYLIGMPELHIIPNRTKAKMKGVSIASIGQTINALIGGIPVGKYSKAGHREDIRVKLEETEEDKLSRLNKLFIRNNRGELISLKEVTTIEEKSALSSIYRINRERSITIYANLAKGKSQDKALNKAQEIAKAYLPDGYKVLFSGGSQAFKDSMQGLGLAFILGLIVAYMVLASQYNSFIDPFTVFVALPFSISGAFIALYLGGQSINLYSMIGLILLMGIVKKNSILLVDFTNQLRRQGETNVVTALIKACPIRLRPILMTSIATIVGALPAAISFGPGAESRIPMAISVIGGVIASTVLTLFVVPSVYLLFSKLERGKIK